MSTFVTCSLNNPQCAAVLASYCKTFWASARMSGWTSVLAVLVDCSRWHQLILQTLWSQWLFLFTVHYRQFRGVSRAQMMSTGYCRGTVVGQVQRGKTLKAFEGDHGELEYSLSMGSHLRLHSAGVMWSNFLVPVTTRAAEFCTVWSFFSRPSPMRLPFCCCSSPGTCWRTRGPVS